MYDFSVFFTYRHFSVFFKSKRRFSIAGAGYTVYSVRLLCSQSILHLLN